MDCNEISVSYGESLRLQTPMTIDTQGLVSLTFNIGKGGDLPPELSIVATVTSTLITVYEESVTIPVGAYKYQYTAVYDDGYIAKYPSPTTCNPTLPTFTVTDSIDDPVVS